MKFEYKLTGAGWAECNLNVSGKDYSFSPGYLTDALGELLQSLLDINPFYTEELYVEKGSEFLWDEEPIRSEWHFHYLGEDKMSLKLTIIDDNCCMEDRVTEIYEELSYSKFLELVLNAAEGILKEYGIVGYKNMWLMHEFPLSIFLKLKYYLDHRAKFPTTKETFDETNWVKSDLHFELSYLSSNEK
jgi:hypothetical protein